ncbi:hypothetical protein G9C98_008387, partial [Cotesia typhae]
GRRVCPAETYSRFIVFEIFATLVQNFDFESLKGQPSRPQDKTPGFAVQPKSCWIKFKSRR